MEKIKSVDTKQYAVNPYSKEEIQDAIKVLESMKVYTNKIQDNTYNVYQLESGIAGVDKSCSMWFLNHKHFVVKKNTDGRIAFVGIDSVLDDKWNDCWIINNAKVIESRDSYRLIEEMDTKVKYHIVRCGSICTV